MHLCPKLSGSLQSASSEEMSSLVTNVTVHLKKTIVARKEVSVDTALALAVSVLKNISKLKEQQRSALKLFSLEWMFFTLFQTGFGGLIH